jgi:hypothetical protein
MTLIMGMFLPSRCAGGCGVTVYTVPHYLGAGRCVDCGRRHHGAAVPVRPVPGSQNHLPMGQYGRSNPCRSVDNRDGEIAAARAAVLAKRPRPAGGPRLPTVDDGLPRTFWSLAHQSGAVAVVREFDVWRIASGKDDRPAGWSRQWRAGVLVSGRVSYWWRWADVAKWTPAGSRAVLERTEGA